MIGAVAAVIMAGVALALWFAFGGEGSDDPLAELVAPPAMTPPGEVVIRLPGADGDLADDVLITTPDGRSVDGNGAVVRGIDAQPVSLSPAPLPTLIEPGAYGPLPRIGADGLRPFDAYARPTALPAGQTAVIAIVVGGVGINQASSELALSRLPGEISLALAPYGSNLAGWAAQARENGHELFLQLPLEPFDFPVSDPGPHTLLADDPPSDNLDRLDWLLAQFTTYAGVVSYAGGRFLADEEAMSTVVNALAERGLMLIDEGAATQSRATEFALGELPFAAADLVIDREVDASAIAARLAQLEALALQRGYAIATASAFQVTIEQISLWADAARERGIQLVPVTALANDPAIGATQVDAR